MDCIEVDPEEYDDVVEFILRFSRSYENKFALLVGSFPLELMAKLNKAFKHHGTHTKITPYLNNNGACAILLAVLLINQSFSNLTVTMNMNGESTQVQLGVAKFDYEPKFCSPNVDAELSELAFHKGDVILLYGERDEDGWYVGELNGRRAMVPYNFLKYPLQPVNVSASNAGQPQLIMAGNVAAVDTAPATVRQNGIAVSETAAKKSNGDPTQVQKAVAKYDYNPKIQSPNADAEQVELAFHQGDIILLYGERDDDGFYIGELNGRRGLVPYNFLQIPGQPLFFLPFNKSVMTDNADTTFATEQPKGVEFSTKLVIRWIYRIFGFAILLFIVYFYIIQIDAEEPKV
uniref:SH3 domain-containing protein n=1 Tax=Panagrellus redivivus TaxID=6233 RepID=A0A7E4VLV4_PANRE